MTIRLTGFVAVATKQAAPFQAKKAVFQGSAHLQPMGAGSGTLSGVLAAAASKAATSIPEPPLAEVFVFLGMRDVHRLAVVARAWAFAACAHVEQTAPVFFNGSAGAAFCNRTVNARPWVRGGDSHGNRERSGRGDRITTDEAIAEGE